MVSRGHQGIQVRAGHLVARGGPSTRRNPFSAEDRNTTLQATAPNQIYCWDTTYLPTLVRGEYFYLYLFVDLFSCMIVGWQVFDCERAELAGESLEDICLRQGIARGQVTVHSDNGCP